MLIQEFVLRMTLALFLGAAIGFERHWRHKMAGLRTNTLVATGAALFVVLSIMITHDASPSRIASQIVTGIGFLGAGVIMKDGFGVRGLNTAATLWCSAAVGTLCGVGAWEEAILGTVFIIVCHTGLRPLENYLNKLTFAKKPKSNTEQEYLIKVSCKKTEESRIRSILVKQLKTPSTKIIGIRSRDRYDDAAIVQISVNLLSIGEQEEFLENDVISSLQKQEGIKSVNWEIIKHATEF